MKRFYVIVLAGFFFFAPAAVFADTSCAAYLNQTDFDPWGKSIGTHQMIQPFTVAADCTVTAVKIIASISGTPSDHATVSIYDMSGGTPGTLMETGTSVDPTGSFTTLTSTFAGTTVLHPATAYGVLTNRTGSFDSINYYKWGNDNSGVLFSAYYNCSTDLGTCNQQAGYNTSFEVDGTTGGGGGGGGTTGTTTAAVITQQEVLFMFGIALYFLAVPFFTRIFPANGYRYG